MKNFYVYAHLKPDFTPFYIGKGCGNRCYEFSSGRNGFHKNVVKKYGRENIIIEVVECKTEKEAFAREIMAISALRKSGIVLANITNGGEGISGVKKTPEQLAALSKRMTGVVHSEEMKKKISAKLKGRIVSESTKAKLSASLKGNKCAFGAIRSKEVIDKLVANNKAKMPMIVEKIRAALIGKKLSVDHRRKLSEAKIGKKLSEEHKRRIGLSGIGRVLSKETKEKIRLAALSRGIKNKEVKA